jgi:hypothetical protein
VRAESSKLGTLMSADLLSLVFILLMAMASQSASDAANRLVSETPDPTRVFLNRVALCLMHPHNSDKCVAAEELSGRNGMKVTQPGDVDFCTRKPGHGEGLDLPTCRTDRPESTYRVVIDYDEGTVRLLNAFTTNEFTFEESQETFVSYVISVISSVVRFQTQEQKDRNNIAFRDFPVLANARLAALVVEGHTDHQVDNHWSDGHQHTLMSEGRSVGDDNVRLGMRRARTVAIMLRNSGIAPAVLVSSFGCHRPYREITAIQRREGSFGHDPACLRDNASIDKKYEGQYLNPVPIEDAGPKMDTTDNRENVATVLSENRRIEIRVLYRLTGGRQG